jgi:hypothetical protein
MAWHKVLVLALPTIKKATVRMALDAFNDAKRR